MIETIVSDVFSKIAEGSGGALVDLIRRQLTKRHEQPKALESLSRVETGAASEDDERELRALVVRLMSQDQEFMERLQRASAPSSTTNSVTSSIAQKIVQAHTVGDVTM